MLVILIKEYSKEGDTIFDCFMGVGTTGVVCLENNRKFIGVELDSTYFNISQERLTKIATKEIFDFNKK